MTFLEAIEDARSFGFTHASHTTTNTIEMNSLDWYRENYQPEAEGEYLNFSQCIWFYGNGKFEPILRLHVVNYSGWY